MNFENLFSENHSFFKKKSSESMADKGEIFGTEVSFSEEIYDHIIEPILEGVSTATTEVPLIDLSILIDEDYDEENEIEFQGQTEYPAELGLEGFLVKKNLKMIVTTTRKFSIIRILSIPTEFICDYKPDISGYFPDLKDELSSLCRMIMVEDDDKLTEDAIDLKKSLLRHFEKQ